MFNKIKGAFINAVNNLDGQLEPIGMTGDHYVGPSRSSGDIGTGLGPRPIFALPSNLKRMSKGYVSYKYKYTRPHFLQLNTDDEIQVSADQIIRPIIVPRDIAKLSWNSGYAEAVNAGKSQRNEDQAAIHKGLLRAVVSEEVIQNKITEMISLRRVSMRRVSMVSVKDSRKRVPVKISSNQNVSRSKFEPPIIDNMSDGESSTVNSSLSKPQVSKEEGGTGDETKVGKSIEKSATEIDQEIGEDAVISCSTDTHSHSSSSTEEPSILTSEDISSEKVSSSTSSCSVKDDNKVNGPLTWNGTADDLLSPSTPLPFTPTTTAEAITHSIVSSITSSADKKQSSQQVEESLPYVYFGIFDGHAGSDVAVAAANRLHKIVHENLSSIADLLIAFGIEEYPWQSDNCEVSTSPNENSKGVIYQPNFPPDTYFSVHDPVKDKTVSVDNLITGALEKAFWDMDQEIERDKIAYYMRGGCTALVALFILGKLYIANAGDSRAIVHLNSEVIPMSFDFTPASERTRIKYLGLLRPDFLGNDFTHLEFIRRPLRNDLGKELLYRDAFMSGWAYKTVKPEDLKFPLIYGEGKRSRVAATIGVTRGFGDHELKAANSDIYVKPFLTPQPEVKCLDLETVNLTESDVLIMGTDGLWDVTTNEKAAEIVQKALDHFPANDPQRFKYRYISAAQDLVMHSRGKSKENGSWRTQNDEQATIDDISTFVIPLKPYQQEYFKWKEARRLVRLQSQNASSVQLKVPTTINKLPTVQEQPEANSISHPK